MNENYLSITELNSTYQTQTQTQTSYEYEYYFLIQILIELIIFTGNLFIILVIRLNKTLFSNNTLRIVLSLSITDLLLSIMVLPFTFYSQISFSNWNLGFHTCALWLASDIQLTTTSIFHLCSISYERYLSVAKPVQFRNNIKKRIMFLITFNWLISFILVTLPFLLISNIRPSFIYREPNSCFLYSSVFMSYTTTISFWIPLVFMVFFGLRSVYLIRKIDKSHLRMNSHSTITDTTPRSSFQDFESVNINNTRKNSDQCLGMGKKFSLDYVVKKRSNSMSYFNSGSKMCRKMPINDEASSCSSFLPNKQILGNQRPRNESFQSEELSILRRLSSLRKLSRFSGLRRSLFGKSIRKELKAQKTLTIALIVFLLSYFPLFTFLTVSSFTDIFLSFKSDVTSKVQEEPTLKDILFYSTTWLGYSSAAVNPFLQFFLNNNFKNALKICFRKK